MTTNRWGIPDWRDASAYGHVEKWTVDRWRWEFFRRRDDLREFFDRWKDATYQANLGVNQGLRPDSAGFLAFGEGAEKRTCFREFDYAGVPNPRISDQPSGAIIPFDKLIYRTRFLDPAKADRRRRGVLEVVNELEETRFDLFLKPNELAIKFDLNAPLNPQIEIAREALRNKQKRLHGRLVRRVKHQAKWFDYLRTLDARETKASWSEIASLHPETAQTAQTGRDKWHQADALRFNF